MGGKKASSVHARIVQVSYGMKRSEILRFLENFGEVIAIYFEAEVKKRRLIYQGTGFVQFRDPRSLVKA
eukprot:19741-Karenia_brevis.AAC.1